jgi:hypothetical protein
MLFGHGDSAVGACVAARHRRDHRADRRAALEQLEDVLGADGLQLTAEECAPLEAPGTAPAGLSPADAARVDRDPRRAVAGHDALSQRSGATKASL